MRIKGRLWQTLSHDLLARLLDNKWNNTGHELRFKSYYFYK